MDCVHYPAAGSGFTLARNLFLLSDGIQNGKPCCRHFYRQESEPVGSDGILL
ncbi:hypothetical protein HHC21_04700 [Neisseria meningitidis]|uniref:hypothetical protein n=1 Tax=Neisseria TaxID=482 RepID=UPI001C582C0C|nr:hypothetical protein [Neisseria meningitidis]MBW3875641.1 hypothetical protein [Neisseria meningitidis]